MELAFWNGGSPALAVITGTGNRRRCTAPDGRVLTGGLSPDPDIDLYELTRTATAAPWQSVSSVDWSLTDGRIVWTPTMDVRPAGEVRDERIAELADWRWKVETGGVMVGGSLIRTDDRTKTLLNGAKAKADAEADDDATRLMKLSTGFVTLSNGQIKSIWSAVTDFVQDCFDREHAHREALELISSAEDIHGYRFDRASDWPTASGFGGFAS
jgi:hypothetical protein